MRGFIRWLAHALMMVAFEFAKTHTPLQMDRRLPISQTPVSALDDDLDDSISIEDVEFDEPCERTQRTLLGLESSSYH
jgi:hypothetical protein